MSREDSSPKRASQLQPGWAFVCDTTPKAPALPILPEDTQLPRYEPPTPGNLESGLQDIEKPKTPRQSAIELPGTGCRLAFTGLFRHRGHRQLCLKPLCISLGTFLLLFVTFICIAETLYLRPLNANRTLLAESPIDSYGLTLVEHVVPRRSEPIIKSV